VARRQRRKTAQKKVLYRQFRCRERVAEAVAEAGRRTAQALQDATACRKAGPAEQACPRCRSGGLWWRVRDGWCRLPLGAERSGGAASAEGMKPGYSARTSFSEQRLRVERRNAGRVSAKRAARGCCDWRDRQPGGHWPESVC